MLSVGLQHQWRRRAVAYPGGQPGADVLDVCTGTVDFALARRVGPEGRVVATDCCNAKRGRVVQPRRLCVFAAHGCRFPSAERLGRAMCLQAFVDAEVQPLNGGIVMSTERNGLHSP